MLEKSGLVVIDGKGEWVVSMKYLVVLGNLMRVDVFIL